ncbi:hypothetical protein VPHK460_0060 [Vibrio phage K460]
MKNKLIEFRETLSGRKTILSEVSYYKRNVQRLSLTGVHYKLLVVEAVST